MAFRSPFDEPCENPKIEETIIGDVITIQTPVTKSFRHLKRVTISNWRKNEDIKTVFARRIEIMPKITIKSMTVVSKTGDIFIHFSKNAKINLIKQGEDFDIHIHG